MILKSRWVDVLAKAAVPISQLSPMIIALGNGISYLNTKFISSSKAAIYFKKQLNKVAGNAVRVAILTLGLAFGRLEYSIMSAGGACKFLSSAIKKIPVIGWILTVVSAVIALFKLLWDKCEGFRRLLFGIWEVIKLPFVLIGNVISSIWDAAVGLFQSLMARAKQIIGSIIQWIKGIFSGIGGWFSKVMQPVKDWFSNLKTFVKSIFDSIFGWLGKVFSPIIELWNKISAKYKIGAEKGSESFRRSKNPDDPDDPDFGIADPTLPGISSEEISGNGGVVPSDVSSGVSATTTGGTRNTSVTINLGKMADVTFNGSVKENAEDMVRTLEECLLRVLYMAQNA